MVKFIEINVGGQPVLFNSNNIWKIENLTQRVDENDINGQRHPELVGERTVRRIYLIHPANGYVDTNLTLEQIKEELEN